MVVARGSLDIMSVRTWNRFPVFRRGLLVCLLFLVGGCSHLVPVDGGEGRQLLPKIGFVADDGIRPRYRLSVGDRLDIKFFYTPELNESVVIRPDGRLSLQLVGDIQAAGATVDDLRARLRERYATILTEPELAVIVKSFTPPFIYVGGEVGKPGRVELAGRQMTVLEAILAAGDFTRGAERRNVIVLRNENGQTRALTLNLRDYIAARQRQPQRTARRSPRLRCPDSQCLSPAQPFADNDVADLVLQAQDIVYVPEAQISQLAGFFRDYLDEILPIYGNMGLVLNYDLNNKVRIQTR